MSLEALRRPWVPAFAGMTGRMRSAAVHPAVIPAKAGTQYAEP